MKLCDELEDIGPRAFYECSGISGLLSLPNSLTTINGYVFYGCTGISITGNYKIETQIKMNGFVSDYNNIWGTGSVNFESWIPNNGRQLCFRSNNTKFTSSNTMETGAKYTITEEVKNAVQAANAIESVNQDTAKNGTDNDGF